MSDQHPFAEYVKILGRGPNLSRGLTEEEARRAFAMIIAGDVLPVQLGAFLCLLRVRTETPEDLAGLVRAIREAYPRPANALRPDLDWPSYAGKARELPWYLLSAILLAQSGIRVLVHGLAGREGERLQAGPMLARLGIGPARSLADAAARLEREPIAFLPLENWAPRLKEILDLRSVLGLRSPLNTALRAVNPLGAQAMILGVAHPPYRRLHQASALRLGETHMAVFKGEGGEAERRPGKSLLVVGLSDGRAQDEEWPPYPDSATGGYEGIDDPGRLIALWRGEWDDARAKATVIGTAAVALRVLGRVTNPAEADLAAKSLWTARNTAFLAPAA